MNKPKLCRKPIKDRALWKLAMASQAAAALGLATLLLCPSAAPGQTSTGAPPVSTDTIQADPGKSSEKRKGNPFPQN